MARADATSPDRRLAGAASGDAGQSEFTAAAQASPWVRFQGGRFFMGAWPGTVTPVGGQVQLQCTPDGGTTVLNVSLPSGADNTWAVPVTQFPEVHSEMDFAYRLYCSALTSGRIAWRLSQ
jgi:hypothetical protein